VVDNFSVGGVSVCKNKNVKPMWDMPEFARIQNYDADIVLLTMGMNGDNRHLEF